ncbi:MAG: hypothetical protein H6Q72_4119 [Firmicutes bacterium]|nr:hypothetical protein [Bacillota bacterium]
MPQIPTYQTSVQINQAPSVRASVNVGPDAFGASAFKGMETLGQGMKAYQDNQDTLAVTTAYNDAMNKVHDSFYGDNGLFYLKGANALGKEATPDQAAIPSMTQQSTTALDQIKNDALKSLNPRQQAIFTRSWAEPSAKYQQAAMEHQHQQQDVAFKDNYTATSDTLGRSFQSNMALASQQGQLDSNNAILKLADQNMLDIKANEQSFGQKNGLTQQEIDNNVSTRWNSAIKSSILGLITDGNIDAANSELKWFNDKVDAGTYADIEAKLKPAITKQTAQKISDSLISMFGTDGDKGLKYLKDKYGNKEEFDTYFKTYRSNLAFARETQTANNKATYQSTLGEMLKYTNDPATMQSILDKADLQPSDRLTCQRFIDGKVKIITKNAKGTATSDESWAIKYGKSQLTNDTLKIQQLESEYNADPESFTDTKWNAYSLLKSRVNHYLSIIGGNSQPEQPRLSAPQDDPNATWYYTVANAIKAKYPDATTEEIEAYMTKKIQEAGG